MTCPTFAGPHLGLAADPSLVAAASAATLHGEYGGKANDNTGDLNDDGEDDEDGAFGDFWRASARCALPADLISTGGRRERMDGQNNVGRYSGHF